MKNRTFAKLISLILALLMVATVFVACDKDGNETNEESETTAPVQNGGNENDVPENAYTADTEGAVDLSAYTLIRPKELDSDGTKAVTTFVNYLKEYCGVEVASKKDNTVKNKDGKEILVGLTDREASIDVYAGLKTKDWSVSVNGDKIVLAAGSEASLISATNWMVENALQKNNKYAKIGTGYSYNHEYAASDIKVGDKVYTDITVAYLNKDNVSFVEAGLLLADNLTMTAGVNTSVGSYENAEGLSILVCGALVAKDMGIMPSGLTVGSGQYAITQKGDDIMIISDDGIGAEAAAQKIIKAILAADKQAVDLKTLCTTGAVEYNYKTDALDLTVGAEYRIMSYNVERVELGGNTRYQSMVDAVTFYNPDVVGFQDYCVDYKANATTLLEAAGYTMVNPEPAKCSEEDNTCAERYSMTNNYTPIAYKTAKFDLVASGAKRIVPCRANEDGVYENTVQPTEGYPGYTITWAVLKDKITGDTFAVTSLHNLEGQKTENLEAKTNNLNAIVIPLVEKIVADNNCPVFMTGDYNSYATDADLANTILNGDKFVNSKDEAVRGYAEGASTVTKGTLAFDANGSPVDHIFMTGEATVVRHRYGLSKVTNNASEHMPVMIDVVI